MKVYILTCKTSYFDIKSNKILQVYDSYYKAKLNKCKFTDLFNSNKYNFDYFIIEIEEQEVR